MGQPQPDDRVGQLDRAVATRLALPRRQQPETRSDRHEVGADSIDLAPEARALPSKRLGELAGSHPEEPGDLQVELASSLLRRDRPSPSDRLWRHVRRHRGE